MFETIITAATGSLIGVAVGGAITAKVIAAVTKADLRALKERVDKHEERFTRVVHRDHCTSCGKGDAERSLRMDERHAEVIRRIETLEVAFRDCFEDLVRLLKTQGKQ